MDSRLVKHELGYWEVAGKPTRQALRAFYEERYFQEQHGCYQTDYSAGELRYLCAKIEQRLSVIWRLRGREAGSLLDVGCGEGHVLAFFRKEGWAVKGFDFSSAGVKSQYPDCVDALVTGDVFELLADEAVS